MKTVWYHIRISACLTIFLVSSALIAASVTATVKADSTTNVEPDFSQRWYVGGGIGLSELQPEPREPQILTVGDEDDTGFHLNIGYDLYRWLSTELYFSSLGEAVLDRIDAGNEQASLDSIDYLVLDIAAVAYLFNSKSGFAWSDDTGGMFCREALSLFGRISLGFMRNDNTENRIDHKRNYNQHLGFGAGLEYGFRNGLAIRGELISFDSDARYTNIALVKRFGNSSCENRPVANQISPEPEKQTVPVAPIPKLAPASPPIGPLTSYFGYDKHILGNEPSNELSEFSERILYTPGTVNLTGHTDSVGSEAYNMYLSEKRVLEVRRVLIQNHVAPGRIRIRHLGESSPVSENDTVAGRALNRRVNIEFIPD